MDTVKPSTELTAYPTCTAAPCASMKPPRSVVAGRDISRGSRPFRVSSAALAPSPLAFETRTNSSYSLACGLHLCKLIRAFFTKVVVPTNKHNLGFAGHYRFYRNIHAARRASHTGRTHRATYKPFRSGGTRCNGGFDGARCGQQKHVDPRRHNINQLLLKNITLNFTVQQTLAKSGANGRHSTQATSLGVAHLRDVYIPEPSVVRSALQQKIRHILVHLIRVSYTRGHQRLHGRGKQIERGWVDLINNVIRHTQRSGIPSGRDLSSARSAITSPANSTRCTCPATKRSNLRALGTYITAPGLKSTNHVEPCDIQWR